MSARTTPLRSPSFSTMLLALLMGLLFFLCIHQPLLSDPDLSWHLHNAQLLIRQHTFVHHDEPRDSLQRHAAVNPDWLAELVFYIARVRFGVRGLAVLIIGLLEAVLLGVWSLAFLQTRSRWPGLAAAFFFLLFLAAPTVPGPHLFGWINLILELTVLEQYRAGKDRLWLLPPLFFLWVNLHGSWLIGLVLLVVYVATGLVSFRKGALEAWAWAPHQRNRLCLFTAFTIPALFLNPFGWRLVVHPFEMIGRLSLQQAPSLTVLSLRGCAVFLLISAYFAARTLYPRTWTLQEAVTLFIAVLAGFTDVHLLPLTGIILCPMIARELSSFGQPHPCRDKPTFNAAIVLLLLGSTAPHIPGTETLIRQLTKTSPEQPVGSLRQHSLAKLGRGVSG